MECKISIIVPVYNVEQYIGKCLLSIINQTYKENFECLIINDATPDNSMVIVNRLIMKAPLNISFKVINHDKNKGLSEARNTGIRYSNGNYIYFTDSDDFLEPDCLENFSNILKEYPTVELIQGSAKARIKNYDLSHRKDLPRYVNDKKWIKLAFLKRNIFPVTSWNRLIKKDFIIKHKLFFKSGVIHEDEHWNFYICKYLNSIAFCKKNTYNYIVRDGSIMNTASSNSIQSWLTILDDFITDIDSLCRKEQISLIFERLHPIYIFYYKNNDRTCTKLFMKLAKKCTLSGKISIWLLLHLPYSVNKTQIIYTKLFHNLLVKHF